jgi:hypothetical protein
VAWFDQLYSRFGATILDTHFADELVAVLTTVGGVSYPDLRAILSHESDEEDLVSGDRRRRRLITIKLRSCDGNPLPNPEVGATVTITDPKTAIARVWAVVRTEAWSETYIVLNCQRIERVERGLPRYRSAV